jgi:predicted porin
MKKSLLALAIIGAFCGVASAQSSVTLYGSFDGGVRYTDNDKNGNSKTSISSLGTYNSNRWGLRGKEDLGGGMDAHFVLESAFNTGTGAGSGALFGRSSYVGLGGTWGAVDIGRQYTVAFKTIGMYDPFNYKYTSIASAVGATNGVRNDNAIQYTGTFSGLTVRAEHAFGEVAGDSSASSKTALGLGYVNGPISVGGAYGVNNGDPKATIRTYDGKHYTLGAAYNFGAARVAIGFAELKTKTSTIDRTQKDAWIGASYNITPIAAITAAYYDTKYSGPTAYTGAGTADAKVGDNGKKQVAMIGATYALSKRTNFYADIDRTRFGGAKILEKLDSSTGVSVGINHLF